MFSIVTSLGEVRSGGAECVDAKTRIQKLRSCDFFLRNTFSEAILVRLAAARPTHLPEQRSPDGYLGPHLLPASKPGEGAQLGKAVPVWGNI